MAQKLTLDEKIQKFLPLISEDLIFKLTTLRPSLSPVTIESCNGSTSWGFSDASVEYKYPEDSYEFEIWFKQFYEEHFDKMNGIKEFEEDEKKLLEHLMDAVFNDQNLICLQRLLTEELTEAEITVLLALHYFKPLMYGCCSYFIDSKSKHFRKCKLCKEDVVYGDTSLGNNKVWHGRADVLLHRSAISVCLEKNLADLNLSSNEEDDLSSDEEDDLSSDKEEEDNFSNGDQYLIKEKKSKCQALSQGITNAFCQAGKNKDLFKQFIPSFLVTEKYITIIMYNCEFDKLLMSGKYPIWETNKNKLDLSTIFKVWITLNYCHKLDETVYDKYRFESSPSSGFKHLVAEVYDTYLSDMKMSQRETLKRGRHWRQEGDIEKRFWASSNFNREQTFFRHHALVDIGSKIIKEK